MAKKKLTPVIKKKKTRSIQTQGFWHSYSVQRDEFYRQHPRSRVLLGLLIVAFAVALGMMYYNMNIVYVGLTLDHQYGIRYPYVDAAPTLKK